MASIFVGFGLAAMCAVSGLVGWLIRDEKAQSEGVDRCLGCLTRITRERRAEDARARGLLL